MRFWRSVTLAALASILLTSSLCAQTLTVRVSKGNVRARPQATSPVIGKIKQGEQYDVEARQGDWFKILLETGREGWVFKSLVERRREREERPRVAVGPGAPREIGAGLDAMVLVPAGWFLRGSTRRQAEEAKKYTWVKKEWFDFEVPQRSVYLDAFHIDKYPVTNAQFLKFGRPKTAFGSNFNGDRQPVVGVTWFQARDYCGSVGKRLPTEAEWEKAARGVDGRKYSWGDAWNPDRFIWSKNSGGRTHPVDRDYRTHRSPYGAVDMVGNVWEWAADWTGKDYYLSAPKHNPKGPASGSERVVRGGSWLHYDPWMFRAAYRYRYPPDLRLSILGFRCAKAP
jgi:iron(II)-dependent oxidoreductase